MQAEPQRSQYLEAMGLTAWVSRYRLPNAAATPQCEWLEPKAAPSQAPAQRLQALLESSERPPAAAPPPSTVSPRQARRARELLAPEASGTASSAAEPAEPSPTAASTAPQEALRFTLQIAALNGRWLIMLPGQQAPDETARRLLSSLLQAADIVPDTAPVFQAFGWPMVEGLPVEAPLEEAQEGLRAFIDGQRRQGWRPERLLVFGESDTLAPVMALEAGHCRLLDIAGWQGPALGELAQSASAKRDLWPRLIEWRQAWQRVAADEHEGAEGPSSHGPAY